MGELNYQKEKELQEIKKIEDRIELLTQKIIDKRPTKFKMRDLMHDFFASLLVGLTIIFKGHLYKLAETMTIYHVVLVFISTIIILTAAIYFGSYININNKKEWPFFTFWIKRLTGFYAVALIVAFFLIFIFGFNVLLIEPSGLIKVAISLAMPCSIGAAIPTLIKES